MSPCRGHNVVKAVSAVTSQKKKKMNEYNTNAIIGYYGAFFFFKVYQSLTIYISRNLCIVDL